MTATAEVPATITPAPIAPPSYEFRKIGLSQLHPSPWNPRKTFPKASLEELRDSIVANGIMTAMRARPRKAGGFEIAAGHRRRAAGLLAEIVLGRPIDAPVLVGELTDIQFLEIVVFENNNREDLHPLEEAEGFRQLMETAGYDVPRLAKKAGRKVDYVYDRLHLLQLVPKAKQLFLEERFTLGHAIILARLSPEWQEKAIAADPDHRFHREAGLFHSENAGSDLDLDEAGNPYDLLRPVSVKEFQHWVDHAVRFDTKAPDEHLFAETADALVAAEEVELKVIHITRLYQVPDTAKDEEQRVFTERAWQRADGQEGSKECEHSVLGVVVVGPGRGESFAVCIAKEKCTVHYGDRIRDKAKRDRDASKNGATSAAAKNREAEEREALRRQREDEARQLQHARWKKTMPAIAEAVAERVRKASVSALVDVLGEVGKCTPSKRAADLVPQGRSADDALRFLAFGELYRYVGTEHNADYATKLAGRMGVDVKKLLDEHAPIEKADKSKAAK